MSFTNSYTGLFGWKSGQIMKKGLIDVIFASDKRKDVLLFLQDGAKEMREILKNFQATRQSLLPQIRILEEHHLVFHYDDIYELSTIGKLVVDKMIPLLKTVDILESDIDYWGTHNIDFIPPDLLNRICELGCCDLIQVPLHQLFDEDQQFLEEAKNADSLFIVTSFVFPNYKEFFAELIANNVNIKVIFSQDIYEKVIRDIPEDIHHYLETPNVQFYLYHGNFKFLSFSYTNHAVLIRLLNLEGNYDNKRLFCSGNSARGWAKELFEYYLKDSIPVTEL